MRVVDKILNAISFMDDTERSFASAKKISDFIGFSIRIIFCATLTMLALKLEPDSVTYSSGMMLMVFTVTKYGASVFFGFLGLSLSWRMFDYMQSVMTAIMHELMPPNAEGIPRLIIACLFGVIFAVFIMIILIALPLTLLMTVYAANPI